MPTTGPQRLFRPEPSDYSKLDTLVLLALGTITFEFALLIYGYRGIVHDARVYVFQALARLQPDLLGQDIFLRFGSQDKFTSFSPLFSWLIDRLGIESAAAFVTFVSMSAFLIAAWTLARKLTSPFMALVSIGLLVTLPSDYGSHSIFHYLESFATPRMSAQACVLAALVASEDRSYKWTAAWLVLAALIHPIMMMAGFVFLVLRHLGNKQWLYLALLMCGGLLICAPVILNANFAQALRFDDFWFFYGASRVPYVLVTNWTVGDWSSIAVTGATLLIATCESLTEEKRRFFLSALAVGVIGIVVTLTAGDWLKVVVVVQGQPWRTLWLAGVVAVVSLPSTATVLWKSSHFGRAIVLLIASCWLMRGESYGIAFVLLLLTAYAMYRNNGPETQRYRIVLTASCLALLLSVVWCVANTRLFYGVFYPQTNAPDEINKLRGLATDGLLPATLLGLVWCAAVRKTTTARMAMLGGLAILTIITAPIAWAEWRYKIYNEKLFASFAPWRAIIPERSEVLWPTGSLHSWILLQRPSYISGDQSLSALFSHDAAVELNRRASNLLDFLKSEVPEGSVDDRRPKRLLPPPPFAQICTRTSATYVVSRHKFDVDPIDTMPATLPGEFSELKLYRCGK
jgi:hypothetical protein